ncbi:MAG: histone deacetylase family protein, partial [Acidimicrobiia bacterium]
DGMGYNRNLPVSPGTTDDDWIAAVHDLTEEARRFGPAALVVSLGVDAAAADPQSPLEITADGFARAGRALATLGVPTVFVQEGGYDLDQLGPLVLAVLRGFET